MNWALVITKFSRRAVCAALSIAGPVCVLLISNVGPAHAQPKTITMLTGGDAAYTPIFVAENKGYFKDEGLDVSIRMFSSGATATEAFRAIHAQFLASGDVPSIVLWQGNDAVGVAPFYATSENLAAVVRSDIKTAQDLKGRKIATRIGSTAEYFLKTYLSKNGINPSEVNIINLGPEDDTPALLGGNIDGFFIWGPYPALALKVLGSKAHILTTARGYYLEQLYLTANRQFAKANPTTVVKMLKAINRGVAFVRKNPKESDEIVAHQTKGAVDVVNSVVKLQPFDMTYGPKNRDQLEKLINWLKANGKLKSPVAIDKVIDTSYLKAADPKLVVMK